jgi:TRAP-type C4-dicarboxylate transport system permease small subunit
MEKLMVRIARAMALIAGLFLLIIMSIMVVDVVGRYFLNAPLTYSVELVELGMGLFVLFGLAETTLRRGHISVDILNVGIIGPIADKAFRIVADFAGIVFMGVIAWRLLLHGFRVYDDGLFTQVLELPTFPVVFLMFGAAVVATATAVVLLIKPNPSYALQNQNEQNQSTGG